ncbi:hypothetical protein GE061_018096, partial [Apolygus lucorum]
GETALKSYNFKFRREDGDVCQATYKIARNAIGRHKWKCPHLGAKLPADYVDLFGHSGTHSKGGNRKRRKYRKPKAFDLENISAINHLFTADQKENDSKGSEESHKRQKRRRERTRQRKKRFEFKEISDLFGEDNNDSDDSRVIENKHNKHRKHHSNFRRRSLREDKKTIKSSENDRKKLYVEEYGERVQVADSQIHYKKPDEQKKNTIQQPSPSVLKQDKNQTHNVTHTVQVERKIYTIEWDKDSDEKNLAKQGDKKTHTKEQMDSKFEDIPPDGHGEQEQVRKTEVHHRKKKKDKNPHRHHQGRRSAKMIPPFQGRPMDSDVGYTGHKDLWKVNQKAGAISKNGRAKIKRIKIHLDRNKGENKSCVYGQCGPPKTFVKVGKNSIVIVKF